MATEKTKIPPAKSLIFGLRCIGYSFSTALADIIDNSISAKAKNICVYTNSADEPYVAIFDDGVGMGKDELDNAMTLGSNREEKTDEEIELGRFGLGLKSASFSQCLQLTVASKKYSKINAFRYDLNKIQEKNEWLLEELDSFEIDELPEINHLKKCKNGTLVIWKQFDKIEEGTQSFANSFSSTIGLAKKHVELVFHRFYDDINIEFDGHKIEKRDPFLSCFQQRSIKGRKQDIIVNDNIIEVTPYGLPYANTLTEEEKKLLGNPKSIYEDQGFYIYRNKRLIIWGSWLHMNVRSEFNKLAKIKVDIPSSLDSMWMLDVKKSSAKIPDLIKEQLRVSINDSITKSKKEILFPGIKEQEADLPLWRRINLHNGEVKYEINKEDNPLYLQLLKTLNYEQTKILNSYLNKVELFIPKGLIVSDNADSIKILNSDKLQEESELIEEVVEFSKHAEDRIFCVENMLKSQAYKKIEIYKDEIIRRIKNDR